MKYQLRDSKGVPIGVDFDFPDCLPACYLVRSKWYRAVCVGVQADEPQIEYREAEIDWEARAHMPDGTIKRTVVFKE